MAARRHQAVLIIPHHGGQQPIDPVIEPLRQHGVLGQQHPGDSLQGGRLLPRLRQPLAQQQQVDLGVEPGRRRDQTGGAVRQLALMMFGNDEYAHGSTLMSSVDLPVHSPTRSLAATSWPAG
ncbi:hypothetical protein D3C78_828790 [compost metagenome]